MSDSQQIPDAKQLEFQKHVETFIEGDRYESNDVAALLAMTTRFPSIPTRLSRVTCLSLCGNVIGDHGCFVVCCALRFGALRQVKCLDLTYNQLTPTSAFYLGVFLLRRPPSRFYNAKANEYARSQNEGRSDTYIERVLAKISASTQRAQPMYFPPSPAMRTLAHAFFNQGRKTTIVGRINSSTSHHHHGLARSQSLLNATLSPGGAVGLGDPAAPLCPDGSEACDEEDAETSESSMDDSDESGSHVFSDAVERYGRLARFRVFADLDAEAQAEVFQEYARDTSNQATNVVSLRLSWNDFGDLGARMLSSWLPCQKFLSELTLSDNGVTDIGCRAIRDALRATTSVISLSLDGNTCSHAVAESIRGVLLYNRRLQEKHAAEIDPWN